MVWPLAAVKSGPSGALESAVAVPSDVLYSTVTVSDAASLNVTVNATSEPSCADASETLNSGVLVDSPYKINLTTLEKEQLWKT